MDKENQPNIEEQETNATDASLNTVEQTEQDDKGGENARIPYERFKQKVDEVNELKQRLAQIEEEQAKAKRQELEEQERSEEHTSELQSRGHLVCRLLLEKKNKK